MRQIETEKAVGHVLGHDITKIVPGEFKGVAFKKGHVVKEEDIPALLDLGKRNLYVYEVSPGMLHENEAAQMLYSICAGPNMVPSAVSEGKIELFADCDGLFTVDVERLKQINALGEMMIATRLSKSPVRKGDKLAGTRVIPLVIEKEKMDEAVKLAGDAPLLKLLPFMPRKTAVITTGSEVATGRIQDGFTPVLKEKLQEYGSEVIFHRIMADEPEQITTAILQGIEAGAELVLCTGGMSVDPDDRTPLAIKNTGAQMISYGAPVLPGAMLMVAYLNDVPILGLPGCVMYSKRTIFDLVLPKVMAGVKIETGSLCAMGHGGLCLNCEACIFPNCGFGRGV